MKTQDLSVTFYRYGVTQEEMDALMAPREKEAVSELVQNALRAEEEVRDGTRRRGEGSGGHPIHHGSKSDGHLQQNGPAGHAMGRTQDQMAENLEVMRIQQQPDLVIQL